jgi:biotin carboxylase
MKTAIVLGGTNPHIQLIKKLSERGFYTILIDYFPNPPAKPFADIHIQASTMDREGVLSIARDNYVDLVISTNIDHANTTACYVAEQLGLPHPYSYETALNVTDKCRMKQIMWDNGISTSDFVKGENFVKMVMSITNYPVVVKPADSNGSRGVHKCCNYNELLSFFEEAKSVSRSHQVIIERYIEGDEISFYYFIQGGRAHYITSNQRFRFRTGTGGVIQSAGGLYPAPQSKDIYEKMQANADKIALAFKLDNTPIFIQAIVENGEVYILEFAPRIGGGLSYRLIESENQFDIINATIDSFLGNTANLHILQPSLFSAVMNIYAPNIIMDCFSGVKEMINAGLAKEFYQYKEKGAEVSGDMSSGSRVGAFFLQGEDASTIYKKINEINKRIEVYDVNGNAVMRHDIYNV